MSVIWIAITILGINQVFQYWWKSTLTFHYRSLQIQYFDKIQRAEKNNILRHTSSSIQQQMKLVQCYSNTCNTFEWLLYVSPVQRREKSEEETNNLLLAAFLLKLALCWKWEIFIWWVEEVNRCWFPLWCHSEYCWWIFSCHFLLSWPWLCCNRC